MATILGILLFIVPLSLLALLEFPAAFCGSSFASTSTKRLLARRFNILANAIRAKIIQVHFGDKPRFRTSYSYRDYARLCLWLCLRLCWLINMNFIGRNFHLRCTTMGTQWATKNYKLMAGQKRRKHAINIFGAKELNTHAATTDADGNCCKTKQRWRWQTAKLRHCQSTSNSRESNSQTDRKRERESENEVDLWQHQLWMKINNNSTVPALFPHCWHLSPASCSSFFSALTQCMALSRSLCISFTLPGTLSLF